jgi:hypothetical protein
MMWALIFWAASLALVLHLVAIAPVIDDDDR